MKTLSFAAILFSLLLLNLLLCPIATAQETKPEEETIKVETSLINVPVIVGDRDGRYLPGMKQDNFYIVENETKRPIDFFEDQSAPMNVAILIDTSSSTEKILRNIKDAAKDFIKVMRPEDKAMIASFDTIPFIWNDFTSDKKQLTEAIDKIKGTGGSNMFDATHLIIKNHFAPLKGRKAIIVLTDGFVHGKYISEEVLLSELIESDIMIYPLLFSSTSINKLTTSGVSEIRARQMFARSQQIALSRMNPYSLASGGKIFDSSDNNFKTSFQLIADELKKQYVIGFYPTKENEDTTFRIGLRFDPKIFDPSKIVLRTKRIIRYKANKP